MATKLDKVLKREIEIDVDRVQTWTEAGKSLVFVAVDDAFAGVLAVADRVKPEATKAVQRLHDLGLKVVMLTGDTVLGRGTSVVAHPDGALGPYLHSLESLRAFANSPAGVTRLLPGHGPVIDDPGAVLTYYLDHRHERLDQVRTAVAAGHTTPEAIVQHVYADVPQLLWPAAERSVRAQLDYLNS